MQADTTDMATGNGGKRGGKVGLLTLADLDSRTRACKQALALRNALERDLGGDPSTVQRELAQRGAMLGAMLEDQEARYLRGESVELAEYCTLVNTQRRVLIDIGLERKPRDVTPDLSDYLEGKAGE